MIKLAVVGYGYWGPNIVRNVMERPELELWGLCEMNPERVAKFSARYPGVRTSATSRRSWTTRRSTPSSIATPPATHYALVRRALEAGKHVLVEKPLATCRARPRSSGRSPTSEGLMLMPGHTFLYSPAVNKVRELIDSGELGEIYFVTSSRMNLGIYQPDGVVNDLAPHDLSILLYWIGRPVSMVSASGSTVFQERRAGDRLPHALLRGRPDGQRPALLAGAAQGAPDDRRRQQEDGRLRRRRQRRRRPHLRPRLRLHRAARTSASTS